MFRLAALLARSVGELLDTVSYPELLEWADFYGLEPWGEWRADVRTAQVVQTLANINRDSKQHPEPYALSDFMLFEKREQERQRFATETDEGEDEGAHIGAETIQWLFAMSGANDGE